MRDRVTVSFLSCRQKKNQMRIWIQMDKHKRTAHLFHSSQTWSDNNKINEWKVKKKVESIERKKKWKISNENVWNLYLYFTVDVSSFRKMLNANKYNEKWKSEMMIFTENRLNFCLSEKLVFPWNNKKNYLHVKRSKRPTSTQQ